MLDKVLGVKIREYAPANPVEQENVLQELMQHYVLSSFSRAGLFLKALFHGGTCWKSTPIHPLDRPSPPTT
jgi:hypothetical protein